MKLNTERLELTALTAAQLLLWIDNLSALEKELCCRYRAEPVTDIFLEIIKGQLPPIEHDKKNYLWHTFWFIIRKSDRTVVGSIDFKNIPDMDGNVEIGYGLGKEFEHTGYMTESVEAMCLWAFLQERVQHVIAETECGNAASQRVLSRCGFTEYKRAETVWWKREKHAE